MTTQYELSLTDYWRILRKRFRVVIGIFILVVGSTFYMLKKQVPVYRADAIIKIESSEGMTGKLFTGYQSYYENPMVTEARVIESRSIVEVVVKQLAEEEGFTLSPEEFEYKVDSIYGTIEAVPVEETNLLRITVTGTNRKEVARLANAAAEAYLLFNLDERNKQARKVRTFVESQVRRSEVRLKVIEDTIRMMRESGSATGQAVILQGRITTLEGQLADLSPKLTDMHPDIIRLRMQIADLRGQLASLPAEELEFSRLNRELQVTEKTYRNLRERLEEARIAEAEKIANASIIERATIPGSPIQLRKRVGLLVGGLLGLIVGCILAFVVETMDTSIGTIEEIEQLLQVPVIAVIPHFGQQDVSTFRPAWFSFLKLPWKKKGAAHQQATLFAHHSPRAPITEACRILRTNLKFSKERRVILVTSAGPAEGKTTVLSNLGVVTAQSGVRTLLLSGDLRRPSLEHLFDLDREQGVSEVLRGDIPLNKAIRGFSDFILGKFGYDEAVKNPYLANLFLMTAGHIPENPSELLGSPSMRQLLHEVREQFEVVLVDGAPLLPVADSMLLAPHADGVIMVYQVGRISRAALLRAKVQLDSVGANLLGVVLNHVQPEVQTQPKDFYYYRERYATQDSAEADAAGKSDA